MIWKKLEDSRKNSSSGIWCIFHKQVGWWWSTPSWHLPCGYLLMLGLIQKVIKKCKAMFCNCLCIRKEQNTITRINWKDCCSKCDVGPKIKVHWPIKCLSYWLLCKWVLMAMERGESNLKTFICFKLISRRTSNHKY